MNRRLCCVFMPFDRGPHDKRYDDIIAPAIRAARLTPYRVDQDSHAAVPIDTLHAMIQSCKACLADISTANPNVMYEVGYAIAFAKEVILLRSSSGRKIPFDIHHRTVIEYRTEAPRDFEKLKTDICIRLTALAKNRPKGSDSTETSLHPHEISVLCLLIGFPKGLTEHDISERLGELGPQKMFATLSTTKLLSVGFIKAFPIPDFDGSPLVAFQLTQRGLDWLLKHRDDLEPFGK